jgi:hypothetical protein
VSGLTRAAAATCLVWALVASLEGCNSPRNEAGEVMPAPDAGGVDAATGRATPPAAADAQVAVEAPPADARLDVGMDAELDGGACVGGRVLVDGRCVFQCTGCNERNHCSEDVKAVIRQSCDPNTGQCVDTTVSACGAGQSCLDAMCAPAVREGTTLINESAEFDLGSGKLFWSISSGQQGYFYSGSGYTNPPVTIAGVYSPSGCRPDRSGYRGIVTVQDLRNASSLTYSVATISFGTRADPCNGGLLVFKQGDRYGVIDFLSIDGNGRLNIRYWLGNPGVTDFSSTP